MYKVGVIGLGQIAYHIDNDPNRKIIWSHIKAYKNIAKTNILGICDINHDLVEKIKIECKIPKGYTNYENMLSENNFDIISICTPIQTHYDIIKKCIQNGVKAIFCEKTLSYSLEEVEEIIKLCKENNVILGVNYILRWDNLNIEIILGENGRIKLYNNGLAYDLYQYSTEINTAGANYESLKLIKTQQKNNENERMIEAILDIINCLENGGEPLSNGNSSYNSIKIIEGIKNSDKVKNLIKFV